MIRAKHICAALAVLVGPVVTVDAATEEDARAVTQEYDRLHKLWLSEMRLATDARKLKLVAKKRPNPAEYGAKLKTLLRNDLAKDWTLKYGAWLLENDTALRAESQRALLNAVERHHMASPLLGRFCVAMVNLNDGREPPLPGRPSLRSRGMKMLEQVKKRNPDARVQGQAALALSIMLGNLGEDHRIMKQRIENLREAIVKSADVRIGEVTVADIAKEELFKIKNLSKGRVAPNIIGADAAGRRLQLTDYRGKVVMLVFWSSWDTEAARALELLRKIASGKAGRPFVVLGVNRDSYNNLRQLEKDGITTWRNFSDPQQKIAKMYRIGVWPMCMVLDRKGVIQYRGAVGAFADAVANDLLRPE